MFERKKKNKKRIGRFGGAEASDPPAKVTDDKRVYDVPAMKAGFLQCPSGSMRTAQTTSPSNWCPFSPFFGGEGSPTRIDYRKKLVPLA